jgi:hypothetical protein
MSRVNYSKANYCSRCDLALSKSSVRCTHCGQMVRRWARRGEAQRRYRTKA